MGLSASDYMIKIFNSNYEWVSIPKKVSNLRKIGDRNNS